MTWMEGPRRQPDLTTRTRTRQRSAREIDDRRGAMDVGDRLTDEIMDVFYSGKEWKGQ